MNSPLLIISIFVLSALANPAGAKSPSPKDFPKFTKFGPNCWNFVLKYSGAIETYRAVSLAEFMDFMNSSHCVSVSKPQKGDIGSVILPKHGLIHSFIFLNAKTGLSKGTPYPSEQIEFEDLGLKSTAFKMKIEYKRCHFPKDAGVMENDPFAFLKSIEERLDGFLTNKLALSDEELKAMLEELLAVDLKILDNSKAAHKFYSILSNVGVLAPTDGLNSQGAYRLQELVKRAEVEEEAANRRYK